MIKVLHWDSDFFGAKIGKVEKANQYDIKGLIQEKNAKKFERVYLFADEKIKDIDKSLLLVDEKITFSKIVKPTSSNNVNMNMNIGVYNGAMNDELLELALLSGHESRFKKDPFFAGKYESLYKCWLQNSLNRSFADDVIIALIENHIMGFMTLVAKEGVGHIGLIAVSNSSQGQGLGGKLLQHSDSWFFSKGCHSSQVVTQRNNRQACFFYKKNGYRIKKVEYIYHL